MVQLAVKIFPNSAEETDLARVSFFASSIVRPAVVEGLTNEFVSKTLFLIPLTGGVDEEELLELLPQPASRSAATATQMIKTHFLMTHFSRCIIGLNLCSLLLKT